MLYKKLNKYTYFKQVRINHTVTQESS